ncbi:MAG: GNAT family N-acetyltransferase [Fervidobacterium sp.]|uniref:GNAT family N-acetyltransferase n=1 Tax=Fervidobacterium sp. TaxID=1871331 RepID=UPI00404AB643
MPCTSNSTNKIELPTYFGDFLIRQVTSDDIEKAYEMRKNVALESDTILSSPEEITIEGMRSWINSWLQAERKLFVVVEDVKNSNIIVGQLWVWFLDTKKRTSHIAEFGLEILNNYRGQGIGTKLTELAIAWAISKGAKRIEAETLEKNIPMRRIFDKFGFELEGIKKSYLNVNGSYENAVMYSLIID